MNKTTITACVVVYNEEKLIRRCLASIKDLVDEIVVVHDGECSDGTLKIAEEFTKNVFLRPHTGTMEPHLAFAFNQSKSEWVLRIDADEFFEPTTLPEIRNLVENAPADVGSFEFDWQFWDGTKPFANQAFRKKCLFRKSSFHFPGVTHQIGIVNGKNVKIDLLLCHQPLYNNFTWSTFFRKMRHQVPIHANFFFPDLSVYECFNYDINIWLDYVKNVKRNIVWHILFTPFKMCLGQLKNGLWKNWRGINMACQQYVYYLNLYSRIWKMQKQKLAK